MKIQKHFSLKWVLKKISIYYFFTLFILFIYRIVRYTTFNFNMRGSRYWGGQETYRSNNYRFKPEQFTQKKLGHHMHWKLSRKIFLKMRYHIKISFLLFIRLYFRNITFIDSSRSIKRPEKVMSTESNFFWNLSLLKSGYYYTNWLFHLYISIFCLEELVSEGLPWNIGELTNWIRIKLNYTIWLIKFVKIFWRILYYFEIQ